MRTGLRKWKAQFLFLLVLEHFFFARKFLSWKTITIRHYVSDHFSKNHFKQIRVWSIEVLACEQGQQEEVRWIGPGKAQKICTDHKGNSLSIIFILDNFKDDYNSFWSDTDPLPHSISLGTTKTRLPRNFMFRGEIFKWINIGIIYQKVLFYIFYKNFHMTFKGNTIWYSFLGTKIIVMEYGYA